MQGFNSWWPVVLSFILKTVGKLSLKISATCIAVEKKHLAQRLFNLFSWFSTPLLKKTCCANIQFIVVSCVKFYCVLNSFF